MLRLLSYWTLEKIPPTICEILVPLQYLSGKSKSIRDRRDPLKFRCRRPVLCQPTTDIVR